MIASGKPSELPLRKILALQGGEEVGRFLLNLNFMAMA